MTDKAETALADARKERGQIPKAGLGADAAALQKQVDAGISAAATAVATRIQMLKDLESLRARQRQLDADTKALAQRVKASLGANGASRRTLQAAHSAVVAARRQVKPADAALLKLSQAMADLGMELGDYSVFQDLPWR